MYVFGYGSLVALDGPGAVRGRLRGFRRHWGAAMDNWQGGEAVKHYLDPETGERPHIRVAYLDLYERQGEAVNGLALPVDAGRLKALDAREVNYERVDVTAAFEPEERVGAGSPEAPVEQGASVFTYLGLPAARERCRQGVAESNAYVRRAYVSDVRRAFESLDQLGEFDRTTDPPPFPKRHLTLVTPRRAGRQRSICDPNPRHVLRWVRRLVRSRALLGVRSGGGARGCWLR